MSITPFSGTTLSVPSIHPLGRSNISNTASNDAPMKGGPPQLDTLSEKTINSLTLKDINDLAAKPFSVRHKDEDSRAPIHTGINDKHAEMSQTSKSSATKSMFSQSISTSAKLRVDLSVTWTTHEGTKRPLLSS